MSHGFLSSSWQLIDIAYDAFKRSALEGSPQQPGQSRDALISVVFAVAASESFMAELALMAQTVSAQAHPGVPEEPSQITTFADLHEELEKSKASLNAKYLTAYHLLSGRAVDKGATPYQDFALLVELRNALIHPKLDEMGLNDAKDSIVMKYPSIVAKLSSRNLMSPSPPPETAAKWIDLVSTSAVAEWAVKTAAGIIMWIVNALPESKLRHTMHFQYADKFSPLG
jgi:hypothetical protein